MVSMMIRGLPRMDAALLRSIHYDLIGQDAALVVYYSDTEAVGCGFYSQAKHWTWITAGG